MTQEQTKTAQTTEAPKQAKNEAQLFKTHHKFLQTPVRGYGMIAFYRQRFATKDAGLIEKLKKLTRDPALRIYIDPNEPTVDLNTQLNSVALRQEELNDFLADRQAAMSLDAGSNGDKSNIGAVGSNASVLTGGASGTNRFTADELAKAVKTTR
jgi:hypothetical protein